MNYLSKRPLFATIVKACLAAGCGVFLAMYPGQNAFAKRTSQQLSTISVLADPSIAVPLAQIIKLYSGKEKATITVAFGSAKDHAHSISEGADVDVLITVRPEWIEGLKTLGQVDASSQTPLARNRLALVGPADSKHTVDIAAGMLLGNMLHAESAEPMFVIADPQTLNEGGFALEALNTLGLTKEVEPYFNFTNQPAALLKSAAQRRGHGITYYSETVHAPWIKVLGTFPESSHTPIVYYAVAVAGDNMVNARKFIEFMKSDKAKEVFEQNGFDTLFMLTLPEASVPAAQIPANP